MIEPFVLPRTKAARSAHVRGTYRSSFKTNHQSQRNDSSLNSVSSGKSQAGSQKKTVQFTDEEFDEYQRYVAATEWDNNGLYMFMGRRFEDLNTITTIIVNDTKVMALVDTGAAANVLDERTYNSLCNKPDLIQLIKPYYGYGNPNQALPVMGFCVTTVSWKVKTLRAPFIVIQGCQQNSRRTRHGHTQPKSRPCDGHKPEPVN